MMEDYHGDGIDILWDGNPDNMTWTDFVNKQHKFGEKIDLGGYGPTAFDNLAGVVGFIGAVNIPAGAQTGGWGSAGYAKTISPGGPAVGVYGQGDALGANCLAWAFNGRVKDNGFATTLWFCEGDMNIDNVNTVAICYDATGGSSVEPLLSIAYRVGAINPFVTPKRKWQFGFRSEDAAAHVALDVGTATESPNSGSQPIHFWARTPGSPGDRYLNARAFVETGGFFIIEQVVDYGITIIQTRVGGVGQNDLKLFAGNVGIGCADNPAFRLDVGGAARFRGNIGFYNTTPQAKKTVTGSRGGNAALGSLLTQLAALGLITNSTTP